MEKKKLDLVRKFQERTEEDEIRYRKEVKMLKDDFDRRWFHLLSSSLVFQTLLVILRKKRQSVNHYEYQCSLLRDAFYQFSGKIK